MNPLPGTSVPTAEQKLVREDLRNVAIVAHVDHGKTTLVDAMLRQTGVFRENQAVVDRVMDSGDLEREKGITILAKQTTIEVDGIRLNIVDTPGHADFGGEVERSLLMVDSVLLLVDAAEGPLPQTRYVLQKAMARHLPVVVALNKIDRSDARAGEVLDDVYELFMDLGADEHQIEFPVVYTNAKAGTATRDLAIPGTDLRPLLDLLVQVTPPPAYEPDHPLQLLVTNLSANEYVGRMAIGRIVNGTIKVGQRIAVVREEADDTAGTVEPGRTVTLSGGVTALQTARGMERIDIPEAGPGEIVSIAGLPEITIGDTITDPQDPRPLPRLDVDEPTLRMTFGVNTSPLGGRDGKYVTSRQIKARLEKEVLGNVSIQVHPTDSGDTFEVRGRGELQLAVLIEQMRREGYELTGQPPGGHPPRVRRRDAGAVRADHDRHPARLHRRGPAGAGRPQGPPRADDDRRRRPRPDGVRAPGPGPDRLSRAAAHRHPGHRAAAPDRRGLRAVGRRGDPPHERRARLGPDGTSNAYGLFNLQERSELFIGSGVDVYEGMIVGENARSGDMDVNPCKEKKLTNIRTHSHDEALRLTPPRPLTLESAIEFIGSDELVEVTPTAIRLRKRLLVKHERERERGRAYDLARQG